MGWGLAKRDKKSAAVVLASAMAALFLSFGCGHYAEYPIERAHESLGDLDRTEELIVSEGYAGYLVVHLNEAGGTTRHQTVGGQVHEAGNSSFREQRATSNMF